MPPPGGSLNLEPLVGTWFATDEQTAGLVRLELRPHAGRLFVRAFGPNELEPYEWGEAEATTYGADVTAVDAVAFNATFDFGFLVTILAGRVGEGILVLDMFNAFVDSSGRPNYLSREFFHRRGTAIAD
ncbi:MAG TPA: hypothetical protein VFV67_35445 [Actinophytocola sp.]|uniref:hypothetical protein n=1 Tax=Actinophytocola sp. TaxID=1872138 RepID=UPI002DBF067F|nr:hypothetical protein [Actinophytocola sp.]HEU5475951.1 hypothetical protein [Actinophytocola sp.]